MSGEWRQLTDREVIHRRIAEGWPDEAIADSFNAAEIDGRIYYTRNNYADRQALIQTIASLRGADDVGARIFAGKQLKTRVIDLRNAKLTTQEIADHPDVRRSRQRVEQILDEAKTKGWTDPLGR